MKSKTIRFNIIMGMLEGVLSSLHLLQGIIEPTTYAVAMIILTTIHTSGGMYIRTLTSKPLGEL